MSTAACARPARSARASTAFDYLVLTGIRGLGDEGVAHVMAEVRRHAGKIQEFLHATPKCLQDRYGLQATVAHNLAGEVEQAREKAAELFDRAHELGIVLLAPGDPDYPARLHEFYDGEPPLLYARGNAALLETACVALVNSAKPSAETLEHTLGLARRLAEAGQTLVAGAEGPSYNVVGLAAKQCGGAAITVLQHGLFAALKAGPQREPVPLARVLGEAWEPGRSLLVSPFRLDGRWQKGNGPRRDKLVLALAERIVAIEVRADGTIAGLCREALRLRRRVFVCQVVDRRKAARANPSLLAEGAAPLVADPAGSNADLVMAADTQRGLAGLLEGDDLERRRSLGQFFTPPEVAQFMWDMVELLRGQKWNRTARIIDPACGEGVFLRVAIERGQLAPHCFGVDIDETLIPLWQQDERLRSARLFRTNGLLDKPSIGLVPGSFDLVIGNPPFSGRGLKDLLQLVQPSPVRTTARQRKLFDDEPDGAPANDAGAGAPAIARHERAILDCVARQLSRYACWRLRNESDESIEAARDEPPNGGGLFADLDLAADRPVRASDYERMVQAVAAWPADRLLDTSQPAVRDTIRRLASTAIEVFFTERFVQLAKPGGIVAVIVPESILASDQLAPLRRCLMQQVQLLTVVGLPQKVFTGVGAKAKTGILFARRYTDAEKEANAKARATGGVAKRFHSLQILLTTPHMDSKEWSLPDYFSAVIDSAKKVVAANAERSRLVVVKPTGWTPRTEYHRGHTWTVVTLGEIAASNRFNPAYFEDRFAWPEHKLRDLGADVLGRFIPELHPDGSKGITYGQVGSRELDPRGGVRYLQVINIRETGIDFAIKPDRVAEGSHNDPPRSRVQKDDILLTNTAFRGTDTLIGRCVVVSRDYGKLNISQDIDRIRIAGANPYYVATFLKTSYGQLQMQRVIHGVDSQKINFGRIRGLLIPDLAKETQKEVERQYLEMSRFHDRAMSIKERLLEETGVDPGQFGETINSLAEEKPAYCRAMEEATERLKHVIGQLEAVIEARQARLNPFPT
jgi:predicted Rossmann fold nucleotide-binding protein DprA/Smf involved in DNA uptake/SAM-dependent methyltransferase